MSMCCSGFIGCFACARAGAGAGACSCVSPVLLVKEIGDVPADDVQSIIAPCVCVGGEGGGYVE